jgi:hypothetical protein
MSHAFICDAVRTPIGRYAGALASVRTDDLAALPLKALMARNAGVDWSALEDVFYGCVNQAGEDNRNVARMALLLAGLPPSVPGVTVNRLCASSLEAVGQAAERSPGQIRLCNGVHEAASRLAAAGPRIRLALWAALGSSWHQWSQEQEASGACGKGLGWPPTGSEYQI